MRERFLINNIFYLLWASVFLSVLTVLGWLNHVSHGFFQFHEPIDVYIQIRVCSMKKEAGEWK